MLYRYQIGTQRCGIRSLLLVIILFSNLIYIHNIINVYIYIQTHIYIYRFGAVATNLKLKHWLCGCTSQPFLLATAHFHALAFLHSHPHLFQNLIILESTTDWTCWSSRFYHWGVRCFWFVYVNPMSPAGIEIFCAVLELQQKILRCTLIYYFQNEPFSLNDREFGGRVIHW